MSIAFLIIELSTIPPLSLSAYDDYLPVYEELYFDGCLNITEQCLHIPILNDICLEEKEESFYINISSSLDCVSVLNASEAVTVVDDDCKF